VIFYERLYHSMLSGARFCCLRKSSNEQQHRLWNQLLAELLETSQGRDNYLLEEFL
jgi:hypothetical protein